MFFKLEVEGEKVVGLDIEIGYNHRGIELLCQHRTYEQVTFLVERVCGICSNSHPLAYVLAVEDLAGIEVPERAHYIRMIVAELERLHSHLLWFGLAGHFIGYNTVWMWAWRYRESVLDLFELICGNRNHYAMMRIGGVRRDILDEDISAIRKVLNELEEKVGMFIKIVEDDPVLRARLLGVGVLTKEEAVRYGVVGPTARASGVDIDVRRDDPYALYGEVPWDVVVRGSGDVLAKAEVRLLECLESIRIIRGCLARMRPGEIWQELWEIPAGEGIGRVEAPRGEVLHYLRSDGSNMPVRHKIRAPSYMNVPSNEVAALGTSIADAAITLAAVDPCYSCTERMAVARQSDKLYTWKDLLRLSWEKTELLKARLRG